MIYFRLLKLVESGLLKYWLNQYIPNIDKCLVNNHVAGSKKENMIPLKLIDFSGIFLLLGVGLLASFLSFLCELMLRTRN